MRRCLYCLEDLMLEMVSSVFGITACTTCGLRYSAELLESVSIERWEEMLTSDAYEINRSPGDPPSVTITELVR